MPIGQRIRSARAELGFTQRYVAKALGVNQSAVNQWESGLTKPSIGKRVELAALLKISIGDLIPGMPVDEITEAIAQTIRSLPPDKQATLLTMVELFAAAAGDPPPDNPGPRKTRVKQHS
jgi:transcriptional regulator with XRE-family HTH domain